MSAVAVPARPPWQKIEAFAFQGRIAARQGDVRHYVNIEWRHTATQDEILLTTPLGQGVAELRRDDAGARLTTADRRQHTAPGWESLSTHVFGMSLPLDGLPRWLLGETPPSSTGWRVDILDREDSVANALPILIELRREDIELRLKIDEWSEVR